MGLVCIGTLTLELLGFVSPIAFLQQPIQPLPVSNISPRIRSPRPVLDAWFVPFLWSLTIAEISLQKAISDICHPLFLQRSGALISLSSSTVGNCHLCHSNSCTVTCCSCWVAICLHQYLSLPQLPTRPFMGHNAQHLPSTCAGYAPAFAASF